MNAEILPQPPGSKGCVSAFEASVGAFTDDSAPKSAKFSVCLFV